MVVVSAPAHRRWELVAHIGREKKAGRIARTGREWYQDGRVHFEIEKLADPPSRAPWYVALTAVVLGGVVSLSVMLYTARWVILSLAVVVAALVLANRANHTGGCAGIHCAGCRG
jgi:hypothetical protein